MPSIKFIALLATFLYIKRFFQQDIHEQQLSFNVCLYAKTSSKEIINELVHYYAYNGAKYVYVLNDQLVNDAFDEFDYVKVLRNTTLKKCYEENHLKTDVVLKVTDKELVYVDDNEACSKKIIDILDKTIDESMACMAIPIRLFNHAFTLVDRPVSKRDFFKKKRLHPIHFYQYLHVNSIKVKPRPFKQILIKYPPVGERCFRPNQNPKLHVAKVSNKYFQKLVSKRVLNSLNDNSVQKALLCAKNLYI
jgi:hypothetical protein